MRNRSANRLVSLLAPVLGAAVLAGCVSTQAMMLNPDLTLAPTCSKAVEIFTDSAHVGHPYTEVAVLKSSGDQSMTTESDMWASQRKKAAAIGANGIIMGQVKDPGTGAKLAHALIGTSADRKGSAIAIWIPSDTARVREACAKHQ